MRSSSTVYCRLCGDKEPGLKFLRSHILFIHHININKRKSLIPYFSYYPVSKLLSVEITTKLDRYKIGDLPGLWSYKCLCDKIWYNLRKLRNHIVNKFTYCHKNITYEQAKVEYINERRKFLGYTGKKTSIIFMVEV